MLLKPLTFHAPTSLCDATQLCDKLNDFKILAGGTFLLNSMKLLKRKGSKTPENIISLGRLKELKGVERGEDHLTIRAMTTISDLFDSHLLTDNFSVLKTVCRNISTTPIRNMATFGGNLTCRYTWTEMGAVMIALSATMHFSKPGGEEEALAAEDFFKNAAKTNHIFSHAVIPLDREAAISYRRVKKTLHVDQPLLAVCVKTRFVNRQLTETRVVVNNGIAFAQRDSMLENFLNGRNANTHLAQEALDHLDINIYDKRSDDYKKHMFRISLKNAIEELIKNS